MFDNNHVIKRNLRFIPTAKVLIFFRDFQIYVFREKVNIVWLPFNLRVLRWSLRWPLAESLIIIIFCSSSSTQLDSSTQSMIYGLLHVWQSVTRLSFSLSENNRQNKTRRTLSMPFQMAIISHRIYIARSISPFQWSTDQPLVLLMDQSTQFNHQHYDLYI